MKYAIDDALKAICARIAALGMSAQEWAEHDGDSFDSGSHTCAYVYCDDVGLFLFQFDGPRDYRYTAELRLEDVLMIHQGILQEIEIEPWGGVHPEDDGAQRVELDPEMTVHMIIDGINIFVRDVLIPRGMVDDETWDDQEVLRLKHDIAERIARQWRVSWK